MFGKRKKKRDEIKKNLREKLDYKMKSENVAIPEIHTKDFDEIEEQIDEQEVEKEEEHSCLLYTSPSPRDGLLSRMPSSA